MKNKHGQSFFELIVAVGIVSLVVVTLITLGTISVKNSTFSRNKTVAGRLAQDAMEWLRQERDTSWLTFYSHQGVWCINSLSWSIQGNCGNQVINQTIFSREVTLQRSNAQSMQVSVKVSWPEPGGTKSVTIENVLTDWKSQ